MDVALWLDCNKQKENIKAMKEEKEKRELSLSSSFYSHTMMRLDRHSIKIYIRIGKGLSKKKREKKEKKIFT